MTSIVFVFLIQLWRRTLDYNTNAEYHTAFEVLQHFSVQQIRTSERMSSSRGVAVQLPQLSRQRSAEYEGYNPLLFGIVQRSGFSEKIHAANESGCRTSDEILSSILDNDTDQDANHLFLGSGFRDDWQLAAVGHIIHVKSIICSLSFAILNSPRCRTLRLSALVGWACLLRYGDICDSLSRSILPTVAPQPFTSLGTWEQTLHLEKTIHPTSSFSATFTISFS